VEVLVLPEDPVVLLVHADDVGHGGGVAVLVGDDGVDVVDLAQAVAAKREAVAHATEAPLAHVEGVLPAVQRARVAVGDDHLGDGGPVQDGPDAAAVLVADGVQDQALERVHRDAQRPPLPAHEVALDGEAGALGLGDLERAEVVAQRAVVLRVVAAALGGEGHHAQVGHLEHLAGGHVDAGQHALDRPGVAVVGGLLPVVGDAAGDPAALLRGHAEAAGGPRVDLDLGQVGDAPLGHGLPPAVVLGEGGHGDEGLLEEHGRPGVGHLVPGGDLAGLHVDDGLDEVAGRPGHDGEVHPAGHGGAAGLEAASSSLAGSATVTVENSAPSPIRPVARTAATAASISSAVRASSGWRPGAQVGTAGASAAVMVKRYGCPARTAAGCRGPRR
jgi:hypothetical protein